MPRTVNKDVPKEITQIQHFRIDRRYGANSIEEFRRWVRAGGRKLKGLIKWREAEVALYHQESSSTYDPIETWVPARE